jgi:hypothetical protein
VTPLGLEFSSADIGYCANTGESYEASDGHIDDLSWTDDWAKVGYVPLLVGQGFGSLFGLFPWRLKPLIRMVIM